MKNYWILHILYWVVEVFINKLLYNNFWICSGATENKSYGSDLTILALFGILGLVLINNRDSDGQCLSVSWIFI